MKFSAVVKKALIKRQINNSQFAKLMGISVVHAGNLIKNQRRWHEQAMLKACEILGITIEYKIS